MVVFHMEHFSKYFYINYLEILICLFILDFPWGLKLLDLNFSIEEQIVNGMPTNGTGMGKDVSRNNLTLGGEHPREANSQKQIPRQT
jgi:hypothetical protein